VKYLLNQRLKRQQIDTSDFMKTTAITILAFLTLTFCKGQEKKNDNINDKKLKYEGLGDTTFSLGGNVSILDCKPTKDQNYRIYIRTNPKDNIHLQDHSFLTIGAKGDSIAHIPIIFQHFLTDYIELDDCFYVVTTDRKTMGGYTKDFLSKYDKNWRLIWIKKIDKPKYPSGNSVLRLTNNNELILISDEYQPKTSNVGISIRRYNLNGKMISEKLILTKRHSNPISIIPTFDSNFYLTAEQYDQAENTNSLWLFKLTQKGDTIWTKKYPHFYPRQTVLSSNGDLVFYGSNYSPIEDQNKHYHYLKIIVLDIDGNLKWQKDIKQNYYEKAENFIETKNGNFLFSSTITPIKDKGERAYIFELNSNGDLTFERKFEYSIHNVPYLIRTEGQITMIGQKWIGKFGEPENDIFYITKLRE
jgi:hypothetical protein